MRYTWSPLWCTGTIFRTPLQLQIDIIQLSLCNLTAWDWVVARSDLRACEKIYTLKTIYSNIDESHKLVQGEKILKSTLYNPFTWCSKICKTNLCDTIQNSGFWEDQEDGVRFQPGDTREATALFIMFYTSSALWQYQVYTFVKVHRVLKHILEIHSLFCMWY